MAGSGSGFIRQRGSTWTAYWRADGRQRSKGGFTTRRDAAAHLSQITLDLYRGVYSEPTRTTLREWAARWLPALRSEVREKTWTNYEGALRLHILPVLGDTQLNRLTIAQVKALIAALLGTGLSRGTVQQIVITLHRCLKDAAAWGDVGLTRNPADGLASALRPARRPPKVWTAEQARRFLDHCAAAGERWRTAFALDLDTGLRRGELLGLRWADHVHLDDARPYLLIEETLIRIKGRRVTSAPKTEAGRRMVTLSADTVALLRRHREVQELERMAAGAAWREHGLVFCQEDGGHVDPNAVGDAFRRCVLAAGVPVLPMKNLRHSHATLALKAGVPLKVVSKRLGHTSIAVTADIYTAVLDELDQDAADRVAGLLYGPR